MPLSASRGVEIQIWGKTKDETTFTTPETWTVDKGMVKGFVIYTYALSAPQEAWMDMSRAMVIVREDCGIEAGDRLEFLDNVYMVDGDPNSWKVPNRQNKSHHLEIPVKAVP